MIAASRERHTPRLLSCSSSCCPLRYRCILGPVSRPPGLSHGGSVTETKHDRSWDIIQCWKNCSTENDKETVTWPLKKSIKSPFTHVREKFSTVLQLHVQWVTKVMTLDSIRNTWRHHDFCGPLYSYFTQTSWYDSWFIIKPKFWSIF